jgi:hypothetical protein
MLRKFLLAYIALIAAFVLPLNVKKPGSDFKPMPPTPPKVAALAIDLKLASEVSYQNAPVAVQAPQPVNSGSHTDWLIAAGIPQAEWSYVDYIVSHESGWNYLAQNSIGATGLCQALPASKMADAGSDYLTNPVTQLKWCSQYASRYGGWYGSYLAWTSKSWW